MGNIEIAKIAASLNVCYIGAAPKTIKPMELRPGDVPKEVGELEGETVRFPPAFLCEIRADWKFMKVRVVATKHVEHVKLQQQILKLQKVLQECITLEVTLPLKEVLNLTTGWNSQCICHQCWAWESDYLCFPSQLMAKPRRTFDKFKAVCKAHQGQKCPLTTHLLL